MSEGNHFLQVDLPDGSTGFASVSLKHGAAAATAFDLGGNEQLEVQILDIDAADEGTLFAELRPRPKANDVRLSRQIPIPSDGQVSFPWLRPGIYALRIQDSVGAILLTRFVQVEANQQNRIELSIDSEPIRLRLASESGEAYPGATVHTHHNNGLLAGTYSSGANGEVDVFPADDTPLFLCIQTQSGEVAWNVSMPEASADPEQPRDVVLHCNASLRVELYDPSGPLVGQPCHIAGDPIEVEVSPTHTTDSQGRTTFSKLSSGSYLLRVYLPGHWPFNKLFEATVDAPITRIKIPRLANLEVLVENSAGQPLADQPITVWSLDYDKDIKRWWELGALDPMPASWRTDAQGKFVIPVLPEGPFRITCPGAEVRMTLVPGVANSATLRVGL
ncbi:MAG: hypothetical protein JKY61_12955 [Planctomycetes bacterium]|nr:hypothetical protein [Planctomycetota bacterium]